VYSNSIAFVLLFGYIFLCAVLLYDITFLRTKLSGLGGFKCDRKEIAFDLVFNEFIKNNFPDIKTLD
jgi:hypothetical protein